MTMISNIPRDLAEDILSRIPLKSMRAVRLTCKSWNALSKSRSFSKMHIDKAAATREEESQMIVMMNFKLYLISGFVHGDPSTEPQYKLTCVNEQVKISQVYHCQGLLLCILREDDTKVMVWNPYLGQTRWVESRYSPRSCGCDRFSYALGYEDNKSCHSVKFLKFIDDSYGAPENQFFWYEMYDFDTGLWTTLDVTPHWRITFRNRGVSLKGNTYWSAAERTISVGPEEEVFADSIICFDFTSGSFGQLLPLPFSVGHEDYVTLSCVGEEKLAVLLQHNEANPYERDVWITNKIEAEEVSWSLFLRVETEFGKMVPFITETFFIDEEKKIAMGFDEKYYKIFKFNIIGDAGYFRQLNLLERAERKCLPPHVCGYVLFAKMFKKQNIITMISNMLFFFSHMYINNNDDDDGETG